MLTRIPILFCLFLDLIYSAGLMAFCPPLEAENVAIRIGEIQLLHAVKRDLWLLCGDPLSPEVGVSSVYVRTSKVDGGVLVGGDTRGIGNRRSLAVIVGRIQHEFRAIQPKQYPIEPRRRLSICADNFEAQSVTVELDGGRHVEHCKQRSQATNVNRH